VTSGFGGPPLRSRFHKSFPIEFSLTPGSTAQYKNSEGEFQKMQRRRLLAYISRRVDQELLAGNEYLAAENGILRAKIEAGF
jgi:hypothetical protein